MELQNARRRTFDVEYVVVTDENIEEVAAWCQSTVVKDKADAPPYIKIADKNAINTRQTKAFVGDCIVHHMTAGNFKAFGKKAFDKSFETLETVEVFRDAGDGKFVSQTEALSDPEGTVKESVQIPRDASITIASMKYYKGDRG